MDIRERALKLLNKTPKEKLGRIAVQKAKVLGWETGLGPVMNAMPEVFGQQAVLYFPGRSGKFSFPCCEHSGKILLALTPDELSAIRDMLLQSPGIEIWLKSGWYSGIARLLTDAERSDILTELGSDCFRGTAGKYLGRESTEDNVILEVTRNAPCTGTSGPGSKAWIWPLAALLLLFAKKKK